MDRPILFNTEMVKALLEDRKTSTRRIIKQKYDNTHIEWFTNKYGTRLVEKQNNVEGETFGRNSDGTSWQKLLGYRELYPPYKVGDILWVRETWQESEYFDYSIKNGYLYKADFDDETLQDIKERETRWRPSIHMPRIAARIFLKVTDVRVERLQEITHEGILNEGTTVINSGYDRDDYEFCFSTLWNDTVNKKDIYMYGWLANPWVWIIEFKRVEDKE